MERARCWWPVVAVLFAASCGDPGGRDFGVPVATDPTADDSDAQTDDTGNPLDTISASATMSGTSAGPSGDPSGDPSSNTASEPSTSEPTSSSPSTTETTSGSMSTSTTGEEMEVTTSCDSLLVTWGDCLNYGIAQCDNDDATCIVDDPADSTLGTCALLDCVNDCDCPDAPATGTAESRCDAILVGGQTACYLNCSGGATCPDGMDCWQNQICMFPDIVCEGPAPAGTYGDCTDAGTGVCGGGADPLCLVDDPDAAMTGVCAFTGCVTDCDCPAAPATGNAPVACAPIVADSEDNACFLDCSAGQTCPDGMTCFMDFLCMWP